MKDIYTGNGTKNDPRYQNVCVEWTDYAPISLEEVKERIIKEGGTIGFKERKNVQQGCN